MPLNLALALRMGALGSLSPYSAEANALFARMTTQPPTYWKTAADVAIRAMKATTMTSGLSIWDSLDGIGYLAAPTQQAALLNWKGTPNFTINGTPTYTAGSGIMGNATDGWVGTGVNADAGTRFTQNSLSLFTWVESTATNSSPVAGWVSTTDRLRLIWATSNEVSGRFTDSTSMNATNPATATGGFIHGTRTGVNDKAIYVNGASVVTSAATASVALLASEICFLRRGASYSNALISWVGYGAGFTAADAASLYSIMNTFRSSVGPRYFLVVGAGQSNIHRMFLDTTSSTPGNGGSGTGAANSNAMTRVLKPALQALLDAQYSDGRTNTLTLLDTAVSGARVLWESGFNSWWGTIGDPTGTPGLYLTDFDTNIVAAANFSRSQIVVLWGQGEAEASDGTSVRTSDWVAKTKLVFTHMKATASAAKIVLMPLGRNVDVDAGVKAYRAAQDGLVSDTNTGITSCVMAGETLDLERVATNDWHAVSVDVSANGYDRQAKMLALAAAYQFGCLGANYRGPEIASATHGSNTVDVTLSYPTNCAGTDFTPTSAIVGFKVADGGGAKTISAAVRVSATVIRLTTSTALTGSVTVEYDPTPGALDRTKMPQDNNGAVGMPLRVHASMAA